MNFSFQGELTVLIVHQLEVSSFLTGYHVFRNSQIPFVGEVLSCRIEPSNIVDKYAVAVSNKDEVVGHLKKVTSGKFAKTVFFFLKTDTINTASMEITGKVIIEGKEWDCKSYVKLHLLVVNPFQIS